MGTASHDWGKNIHLCCFEYRNAQIVFGLIIGDQSKIISNYARLQRDSEIPKRHYCFYNMKLFFVAAF